MSDIKAWHRYWQQDLEDINSNMAEPEDAMTRERAAQRTIAALEKRIEELEAENEERRDQIVSLQNQMFKERGVLTAERQRREECEAALDYVEPNLMNGSNSWLAVRAYRSRYPSESDNRQVAG